MESGVLMSARVNENSERIRQEVERIVSHEGMELVDIEHRREKSGWVLRIFIDREGGVRISDCAEVSRQVGMMLDVEDLVKHRYTLEVSSPGLDRRLFKREDYVRFAGKKVRVKLDASQEGRKKFHGRLAGVEGDTVIVEDADEGCTHRLPLAKIASARLEIEL